MIQVAQDLNSLSTKEREIRAMLDAMRSLGISSGLILTESDAEDVLEEGSTIKIRSLAEWLLSEGKS